MSLLVLGSQESSADALRGTLMGLGYDILFASDADAAAQVCKNGGVQLVLFSDLAFLPHINGLPAGVGAVLLAPDEFSAQDVLSYMRHGVHDCWQLPMGDDEVAARTNAVLNQMHNLTTRAHAELAEMRNELERDQRAGQYVQLGMLPPNPMGIGHYRLQHRVEPSLILSGDFVDYFQITERYFACYVADVAGHGASSAFVTVLLKNFSRRLRREYSNSMLTRAGEILQWINRELMDQQIDKHVAMFIGVIDTKSNMLRYSNAAHFPPAMLVHEGRVQTLEQKGKPLGLFPDATFDTLETEFEPGARLVVFSDGILDLVDADTLLEKEAVLLESVIRNEDMETLWASIDISNLGSDDVSCLLVNHGA